MTLIVLILTWLHVAISLVGIASGVWMCAGMLTGKWLEKTTAVFLVSTIATSVTGFMFPFNGFLPSHGVGILSLLLLPIAVFAKYGGGLAGHWRWIFITTSMAALYLNVFVLVVQLFQKVPLLHRLAPEQNEPAFTMAQLVVLVLFLTLTVMALIRGRGNHLPEQAALAQSA